MKVSPGLVGRIVSIQLTRPVYITDYKAHVKMTDGRAFLMGAPVMTKTDRGHGPVVMDLLPGCEVLEVRDDAVVVALLEGANVIHKTIDAALIVCIDEVMEFEADEVPTVTEHRRAEPEGPRRIIAP